MIRRYALSSELRNIPAKVALDQEDIKGEIDARQQHECHYNILYIRRVISNARVLC